MLKMSVLAVNHFPLKIMKPLNTRLIKLGPFLIEGHLDENGFHNGFNYLVGGDNLFEENDIIFLIEEISNNIEQILDKYWISYKALFKDKIIICYKSKKL